MGGAGSGNPALVRLLLEQGAQADLASNTGHLPVHRAAAKGHLRLVTDPRAESFEVHVL